jgi:hypothetical protein
VSLSSGDEVPHIFTRKSRLQSGEFLITSANQLGKMQIKSPMSRFAIGDAVEAKVLTRRAQKRTRARDLSCREHGPEVQTRHRYCPRGSNSA